MHGYTVISVFAAPSGLYPSERLLHHKGTEHNVQELRNRQEDWIEMRGVGITNRNPTEATVRSILNNLIQMTANPLLLRCGYNIHRGVRMEIEPLGFEVTRSSTSCLEPIGHVSPRI